MCRLWLLLLLANVQAVTLATAQAASPTSAPVAPPATRRPPNELREPSAANRVTGSPASDLPPTTPVITIRGFCPPSTAGAAPAAQGECKTVVTRSDFEKLANALQPKMTPQVRRQLANQYPQILYWSEEAKKRGLEKDPHYLEMLEFTKMELLKVELERTLEDQAEQVPEAEIKDYYEKNSKNFEQVSVLRIFVPKVKQMQAKEGASAADAEAARKESEAAMGKVADDLHSRAAAGEDFEKLQKAAYEAAGIKASAPPTLNPKLRRSNLPASQGSVFDLKEGELSPVISDVSGFYIYKIVSRTTPTISDAQDEIRNTLRSQRLQAMRQKMQAAVSSELNKDYFGPDMPPGPPGMPAGARPMPPSRRPAPTPPVTAQPKE
jgi:peptidyl-prolyl cis-trans isomerase C